MVENRSFLDTIAATILHCQEALPHEQLVIVPNKRSIRILQKKIAQQANRGLILPVILTVNDFVESLSPLRLIPREELLLHLFDLARKTEIEKGDFSSFLNWAPAFLSEINELDLQLIDGNAIYTQLHEYKELDLTFLKENSSDFQKKYLEFYKSLGELYDQFVAYLKEQKMGYEGLMYRTVAEELRSGDQDNHPLDQKYKWSKKIWFAGFYTLSPAEQEIFYYFYQKLNGEFIFDVDLFYKEEYGKPVIDIQNKFRIREIQYRNDYYDVPKKVEVSSLNGSLNQIQYAIDLLNRIEKEEGNLDNTALIFADETLLVPFVQAYDPRKANISMGYPIYKTSSYQLLTILLNLTKNRIRYREINEEGEAPFYYKDLLNFFENQLIIRTLFDNDNDVEVLKKRIIQKGQIYIPPNFFNIKIPKIALEGKQIIKDLITFFDEILSKLDTDLSDYTILTLIVNKLHEAEQLLAPFDLDDSLLDFDSVIYLINSLVNQITLSFVGDPDRGLQISGLLETRTLEYKNLIFLSINEGVLPKGGKSPGFILNEIKYHFKFPTAQEKDSIFAYHFFRLMQRASLVYVLYDNNSTVRLAEESRLIKQLRFGTEKRKHHVELSFKQVEQNQSLKKSKDSGIIVEKDEAILEKMRNINYSPSGLATYIRCPLNFYLANVLKITPPDELNEGFENNLVGLIIHSILKKLLDQIKENPAQFREIIKENRAKLEDLIYQAAISELETDQSALQQGGFVLVKKIVERQIETYLRFLLEELEKNEIEIIANEVQLLNQFETSYGTVTLKGTADRIDFYNNRLRILDYKTGYVDAKNLTLEEIDETIIDPNHSQLFQLLFYLYLYAHNQDLPPTASSQAAIISFIRLVQNLDPYVYIQVINGKEVEPFLFQSEHLKQFSELLKSLLDNILDPNTPFCQTDNWDHCKYCDFRELCEREAKSYF